MVPKNWRLQANCLGVDPELFMPEGRGSQSQTAREVCANCLVQGPCLEEAMTGWATTNARLQGIWAGTSEKERKRLRREKRLA